MVIASQPPKLIAVVSIEQISTTKSGTNFGAPRLNNWAGGKVVAVLLWLQEWSYPTTRLQHEAII
jgi:hypothetical protein